MLKYFWQYFFDKRTTQIFSNHSVFMMVVEVILSKDCVVIAIIVWCFCSSWKIALEKNIFISEIHNPYILGSSLRNLSNQFNASIEVHLNKLPAVILQRKILSNIWFIENVEETSIIMDKNSMHLQFYACCKQIITSECLYTWLPYKFSVNMFNTGSYITDIFEIVHDKVIIFRSLFFIV